MAEKLELLKQDAEKAYKEADSSGKKLLEKLYPKAFNTKITDRIKTFDDALEACGISKMAFMIWASPVAPDDVAYAKLKIIAKALNEGWMPNWKNGSEEKWFPYFNMEDGFSFIGVRYSYVCTDVSSRLCFKSRELAEYAGTQFLDIYKAFMVI